MAAALVDVQEGKMSAARASDFYLIPYSSLLRHLFDPPKSDKPGPVPIVSEAVKKQIRQWVDDEAKAGTPPTKRELLIEIALRVEQEHKAFKTKRGLPSESVWLRLRDELRFSLRPLPKLAGVRRLFESSSSLKEYMLKLGWFMFSPDSPWPFSVDRIINMDECNVVIDRKKTKLNRVVLRGDKEARVIEDSYTESCTLISCVTAAGFHIPPFILVRGAKVDAEFYGNAPKGVKIEATESGITNDMMHMLAIRHINEHVRRLPGVGNDPLLLLADNHASRYTNEHIGLLHESNIHSLTFVPHTTHKTQALDKSVFGPLKTAFDGCVTAFQREQRVLTDLGFDKERITKKTMTQYICQAVDESHTPVNITSGFSGTGVWPYDPSKIIPLSELPSFEPVRVGDSVDEKYRKGAEMYNQMAERSNFVFPPEGPVPKTKTRRSTALTVEDLSLVLRDAKKPEKKSKKKSADEKAPTKKAPAKKAPAKKASTTKKAATGEEKEKRGVKRASSSAKSRKGRKKTAKRFESDDEWEGEWNEESDDEWKEESGEFNDPAPPASETARKIPIERPTRKAKDGGLAAVLACNEYERSRAVKTNKSKEPQEG